MVGLPIDYRFLVFMENGFCNHITGAWKGMGPLSIGEGCVFYVKDMSGRAQILHSIASDPTRQVIFCPNYSMESCKPMARQALPD